MNKNRKGLTQKEIEERLEKRAEEVREQAEKLKRTTYTSPGDLFIGPGLYPSTKEKKPDDNGH